MPGYFIDPQNEADLRMRALSQLTANAGAEDVRSRSSAALRVLHELAASPSTAADALAMLHELQVYQVELDLQNEELRNTRAQFEASLSRQVQLYDYAPVSSFTIDRDTTLHEINRTGAHLLGFTREVLLGRTLDSFLVPPSGRTLHLMLTRVGEGKDGEVCTLQLMGRDGTARSVHAIASADPAGARFFVAFINGGAKTPLPAA
jgi:PAS domain S-box-containing protein